MLQQSQLGADPSTVRSMDISFGRPLAAPFLIHVTSGWHDGRTGGHPGVDIQAATGTPVVAMAAGTVITANSEGGGDAGKWVAIQHDNGWVTRSMHFSKVLVKRGQVVARGELIGLSGNTGRSSGPHLHLDLKLAPEWIPLVRREVGAWGPRSYKPHQDGRDGVPAESWVPADSYRQDVIDRARENHIPLYAERVKRQQATDDLIRASFSWSYVALGLGLFGLGAGLYWWLPSRRA
jgi:murein DD-endopeptidase MepM/ murein hydrolase activator NlpD